MRTNRKAPTIRTHEGAPAKHINAELQLQRAVMACMLWEDTFYESGEDIAKRIATLVPQVDPERVAFIATEARSAMKLRHAPLLVAREMARWDPHKPYVRQTLNDVIQRADELAEFLALYWKDGKQPIAKQVKLALQDIFTSDRFNEYQYAKYNRDGTVKLRDVMFLARPTPKNKAQAKLFKKIAEQTLDIPDTWEVNLSAGEDKRATFMRLISEEKLGAMALLRNLRNMEQAGVPDTYIRNALNHIQPARVLPFRFITAARYAPRFEPELEEAMFKCLTEKPVLTGTTTLLVDVSGSMESNVSGKSEIKRMDAAAGLAMLLRETCQHINVATFSNNTVGIPPRRGFALRDAIVDSQEHGGTYLGAAIRHAEEHLPSDRLIVLTDEQSHDVVSDPTTQRAYMINVASNQNGVGYGKWVHIDGWSESIVDYVAAFEARY